MSKQSDVLTGTGFSIVSYASDPAVGSAGKIYYNTTLGLLKISNGTAWVKVSAELATLSSISGSIFTTIASNITLTGSGFLTDSCVVTFTVGGTDYTVTKTADSDTTISAVAVPAAVYNSAAGASVSIKVTNSDGSISGGLSTTVASLPTGGTITTSGSYRIHTFTSSSSFVVPSGLTLSNVEYLVVAGGAGGGVGNFTGSGGGGGGGLRSSVVGTNSGGGASAEARVTLNAGNYTVIIGAGGSSGLNTQSDAQGYNGSNSVFGSITSIGGGGGGGYGSVGLSGGSGGGGGSSVTAQGSGTYGQGYAGAVGRASTNPQNYPGGGGGGAAGIGLALTGNASGGGPGLQVNIDGNSYYWAGGGGGTGYATRGGPGGIGGGGGGNMSNYATTDGSGAAQGGGSAINTGQNGSYFASGGSGINLGNGGANTGGGSGGIQDGYGNNAGGSGIVIVRYIL